MHKQLRTKMVTALAGVGGITGGIWFAKTPESVSKPYAVIQQIANRTEADTVNSYEVYYMGIDVYDVAVDPSGIETIGNNIYTALNNTTFTLDDYYLIVCKGTRRPYLRAEDANYWRCGTEYEIQVQLK